MATKYIFDYATQTAVSAPAPTVIPPPLDQFYHLPQFNDNWPRQPMWVTGFVFNPAAGTFDFSAVPEFDLSKLQSLWHKPSRQWLYVRPIERPFDLIAVDGVPIPPPPNVALPVLPPVNGVPAPQLPGVLLKVKQVTEFRSYEMRGHRC